MHLARRVLDVVRFTVSLRELFCKVPNFATLTGLTRIPYWFYYAKNGPYGPVVFVRPAQWKSLFFVFNLKKSNFTNGVGKRSSILHVVDATKINCPWISAGDLLNSILIKDLVLGVTSRVNAADRQSMFISTAETLL